MDDSLFQSFFLIFTGAAVLASLALYARQPLLVAYIVVGAILGPPRHAYDVFQHHYWHHTYCLQQSYIIGYAPHRLL